MSAIDFDMEIERLPNPKGDRVRITMSGKFQPYKYYGAEQGILGYGRQGDMTHKMLVTPPPQLLMPGHRGGAATEA